MSLISNNKGMAARAKARLRRQARGRKKIFGTTERPRLVVTRSARHILAQVIAGDREGGLIERCGWNIIQMVVMPGGVLHFYRRAKNSPDAGVVIELIAIRMRVILEPGVGRRV